MNEKLQKARKERRWSVEVAAEKIGISRTTYLRWEHGRQAPHDSTLLLACEAFKMSAAQLGFEDSIPSHHPVMLYNASTLEMPAPPRTAVPETPHPVPKLDVRLDDMFPSLSRDMIQSLVETARKPESQDMNTSRRKILQGIVEAIITTELASSKFLPVSTAELSNAFESWEQLLAIEDKPARTSANMFSHVSQLVEACWRLCNTGETDIARQVLDSFLPEMIRLALSRREAASIAAEGLRLQSILSAHQLQLSAMISFCQQAVFFARLANDPNALSAALNGLAVAFKYAGKLDASFTCYQEALACSTQASPLLRTRVYAGAAATFAQRGHPQEAIFYINLAYEHFPDRPEDDPYFLSADNGIYMLAYYQGLMYLAMHQPNEADSTFDSYKQHPLGKITPERNRLEILNYQGRAAIMANNLEKYVACLEEGIAGATRLRSKKRLDEAINIYRHDVPGSWRHEPTIRHIREQFQLPPGDT